jgi:High potential iron-sulfur protein
MTRIELSRRLLMQKAAAASGAFAMLATIANSAAAQAKSPPQVAGYQTEPKDGQRCSQCQHFQPPSACKVVAGRISAQGWCRLYFAR